MKKYVLFLSVILSASAFAGYTYEISSGYVSDLTLTGVQTLLMTGGGGLHFTGKNFSVLYIQNTSSPIVSGESGLGTISLMYWSTLYFSGGDVAALYFHDEATAILTGGQIGSLVSYYIYPSAASHVTIYCQTGWTYQDGYLSGYWLDGTAFNIKLVTKSGYSDMFSNITIIPEPMTLLLLGAGGLFLRRK